MFSELTDEQILELKTQIRTFLNGHYSFTSISIDGMSVSLSHDNAWKYLTELSKEQKRRRRGGNPFVAVDLRHA
jgi:hypothetical protein